MGQVSLLKVDLKAIEGDGAFPCPSCKTMISPDDESETTYKIVDIKTFKDGSLKALTVLCKKCRSTIVLEGFDLLSELDESREQDEP
jgi:hypothetical protein